MTRKSGLGRGLDALIPGAEGGDRSGVVTLSLAQIKPNPSQPRQDFHQSELDELAESIREHGLIQPVIVTEDPDQDNQYLLIAGQRRWMAAQLAGLDRIPVIVREASDQQRLELALVENVQRADLNALEMAEAYRHLADDFQMTHDEIARRVGKSRVTVTNTMLLLNLANPVKETLLARKISEGHARALNGLPTPEAQIAALHTVLRLELNVRQTEALVQKMKGERPAKVEIPLPPPELSDLETRLSNRFSTKVNVHYYNDGGAIVIRCFSFEELNAIVEQFLDKD